MQLKRPNNHKRADLGRVTRASRVRPDTPAPRSCSGAPALARVLVACRARHRCPTHSSPHVAPVAQVSRALGHASRVDTLLPAPHCVSVACRTAREPRRAGPALGLDFGDRPGTLASLALLFLCRAKNLCLRDMAHIARVGLD